MLYSNDQSMRVKDSTFKPRIFRSNVSRRFRPRSASACNDGCLQRRRRKSDASPHEVAYSHSSLYQCNHCRFKLCLLDGRLQPKCKRLLNIWEDRRLYVTLINGMAPSTSMVLSTDYIQSILRVSTMTDVLVPLERRLLGCIEMSTVKLYIPLRRNKFAAASLAVVICSLWQDQLGCTCGRGRNQRRPAPG